MTPDDHTADAVRGHIHGHRAEVPLSRRASRFAIAVLSGSALVTAVAMALLWPSGQAAGPRGNDRPSRLAGQVVSVDVSACPELPPDVVGPAPQRVCGTVALRLTKGPQSGQVVSAEIPSGPGAPTIEPGDAVVVLHTPDTFVGSAYQIIDHERGEQMLLLVLAAALAVIAFGRWRGAAALAGLGVTFGILLLFVVPAILDGRSALLVAVVGSAAIMLVVLYLTHGFTLSTSIALLGILASLVLTGLLAAITTTALHLTGIASEEASFLTISYQDVDMRGLLLAGILIGTLGVLDDVAITQAATVDELAAANRDLSGRQLYRAAARVGRSHIASVVNTIVLAYAGASLPVLLLLAGARAPAGQMLTSQMLAEEVVRTVVGTMGLLAAVPITTALAAFTAGRAGSRLSTRDAAPERRPRPRRPVESSDPWNEPADAYPPDRRRGSARNLDYPN
jgi:uncharacterized membrane protein